MREWLDSRRFEPAAFRYDHIDAAVIIYVDFTIGDETAAFARIPGQARPIAARPRSYSSGMVARSRLRQACRALSARRRSWAAAVG